MNHLFALPLYQHGMNTQNVLFYRFTLASILLGSAFAYYCVYAAAGALFIAACYYTIKLD